MTDDELVPAARAAVERLAYSPAETAAAIGISRSRLYELLAEGAISARKIGGRTVILRAALDEYLAGLPAYSPEGHDVAAGV